MGKGETEREGECEKGGREGGEGRERERGRERENMKWNYSKFVDIALHLSI